MRIASALASGEFGRRRLLAFGTLVVGAIAAYEFAQYVINDDMTGLAYVALCIAGGAVVVAILHNWRNGVYFFLSWLLFEDFVRKFLGNNMAIYFGKDLLVLVVYISFFMAVRRKESDDFQAAISRASLDVHLVRRNASIQPRLDQPRVRPDGLQNILLLRPIGVCRLRASEFRSGAAAFFRDEYGSGSCDRLSGRRSIHYWSGLSKSRGSGRRPPSAERAVSRVRIGRRRRLPAYFCVRQCRALCGFHHGGMDTRPRIQWLPATCAIKKGGSLAFVAIPITAVGAFLTASGDPSCGGRSTCGNQCGIYLGRTVETGEALRVFDPSNALRSVSDWASFCFSTLTQMLSCRGSRFTKKRSCPIAQQAN